MDTSLHLVAGYQPVVTSSLPSPTYYLLHSGQSAFSSILEKSTFIYHNVSMRESLFGVLNKCVKNEVCDYNSP